MLRIIQKEEIFSGQKVLVRNSEDNIIYRGRVLETPFGTEVQVELIDFGNLIFSSYNDLFVYRDSAFHFLNPMAHLVHINGLEPDKLKSSPSTVFQFIETNYRWSGYLFTATRVPGVKKRGCPTIDLFFRDSGLEFLPQMFESFKSHFMAQTYYQPISAFPMIEIENVLDENDNYQSSTESSLIAGTSGCIKLPIKERVQNGTPQNENFDVNKNSVLALGEDGCYYPLPKQ